MLALLLSLIKQICKYSNQTNTTQNKRLIRMVSILVEHLLKQKIVTIEEMKKINSIEFFESNDQVKEAGSVAKMIKDK